MKHLPRKSVLLAICVIATMSAFGLWTKTEDAATPPMEIMPPTVVSASTEDDETVKFYGSLEWTDRWGEMGSGVYNYGIYSFTIDGGDPYWESRDAVPHTTGGGIYLDEAYYGIAGSSNTQKAMNTFYKYDAISWEYISSKYYECPPSLTHSRAMTHDYSTGKTYALGLNFNDPTMNLREVNLETGEMTNIATLDRSFNALACDADGQLWAFTKAEPFPYKVSLYKIDKNTGKSTFVGDLGYNQKSQYAAACYDIRNNKLYWTAELLESYDQYYQETYASYLMEVDTKTGKATPVKKFEAVNVQFSSLYIMDSHPKAPEAVKNLKFTYKEGEYSKGTISCVLPTKAYDRSTLTGNLKIEVYMDGVLQDTRQNMSPGQTYTGSEISLAEGKHTVLVYCYNAAGQKSLRSEITFLSGEDTPEAVKNLQMSFTPDHKTATLTWEAPETGGNSGIFDAANLTYSVVRRPDGITVATGLKECKFTETPDRVQYLTQYEVYAEAAAGKGQSTYTSPVIIGKSRDLPYLQTFDTQTEFYSMYTLDPKGLAKEDGQYWMYHPSYQLAIYFLSYSNRLEVDGWIVTPALNLKEDYIYRLSYQTQGWASGQPFHREIDIHLGEYPTVESLGRQVASNSFDLIGGQTEVASMLFTAKAKESFIGFHATGSAYDHVSLDNIRVTEYGPSTIPAAPELVSINTSDGNANITVKLPTLDAAGRPVTGITDVYLYTSDLSRRIAGVAVENGQVEATVTDKNPAFDVNKYAVVAKNSSGTGLDLQVSVNMKPDAPKQVENLTLMTANNGNNAVLTWNYPEDMLGVDGNKLTEDDITYDIYRKDNMQSELVASVSGTTSATFSNVLSSYPNERQRYITYSVVARTLGGEAKAVEARGLFGQAFEMPLYENFADGSSLKPWDTSRNTNCSFYTMSRGYNPSCTPTEGKVLTFNPSLSGVMCSGMYVSPRINLTGLNNPKFSFTVYQSTNVKLTRATVQIGLLVEKDGVEQDMVMLTEKYPVKAETDGWQTYSVDLSEYSSYGRASVVLCCQSDERDGQIHFDKIEFTGDKPQYDARLVDISGPEVALMGRENEYFVTVDNNGTSALKNVEVALYADSEEAIATEVIDLAVDEKTTVPFVYTPALDETSRKLYLRAEVKVDNDANVYNNTGEIYVSVEAPNVPYVNDLLAEIDENGDGVHLTWSEAEYYPNEIAQADDIESYPNFAISNIGEWKLYDMDGANTFTGLSDGTYTYTWENIGLPQSFIVFNPKQVGIGGYWSAHSGDKFLASFASSSSQNDDWLVSPELSGHEQTISFYAAAFMQGAIETYDFMISSSGNEPEDFVPLKESVKLISTSWRQQSYKVPAGTRYFAIVCKSENAWALMIDDISYVPAQPAVELTGYNVYRDGERYVTGLGETEYHDKNVNADYNHRYNVTATYTDGESIFSNTAIPVPASVKGVGSDGCEIYAVPGGRIVVKAPVSAPVAVYTIDGRCVYSFASTGMETLSVETGVYIVRAGTATAKLVVK
ncbi:MAG: choice-of-anchor J domain-containing protein [Muribaculaceae bacterium]|nr:choice-of-anchor J domain-containing protein [Muribaculaceae bacterium]